MNGFEKRYQIDNSREADGPREKHHTIERSDQEHREFLSARLIPKMKIVKELLKETQVIDLNEKSKSKTSKRELHKNNPKSNETAVETV